MLRDKKLFSSAILSFAAAFLLAAHPLFAQTTTPPAVPHAQGVDEVNGNSNDFDNDVQKGKDELRHDPEAVRLQNEVVDGEDGEAGGGDGQNDQQGVGEYGDIQNAEQNQGVNEDAQDIHNSGIDEVSDANNLDEASQEIINEHQAQEEGEMQNEQKDGKTPESGAPGQGQDQPDESGGNQ